MPSSKAPIGSRLRGQRTRQLALDPGFIPVAPPVSTRIRPWGYDPAMYERRNKVERLLRRLNGYRRNFSRFEKLDLMFLGFVSIVLVFDGLGMCSQALLVSLRRCRGDAADGGCRASNFSRRRAYMGRRRV